MKVTSATVINYLDCDKVMVDTDVAHPNKGSGVLTFYAEVKPGNGEKWVRDSFGEIKIDIIDRRGERG